MQLQKKSIEIYLDIVIIQSLGLLEHFNYEERYTSKI